MTPPRQTHHVSILETVPGGFPIGSHPFERFVEGWACAGLDEAREKGAERCAEYAGRTGRPYRAQVRVFCTECGGTGRAILSRGSRFLGLAKRKKCATCAGRCSLPLPGEPDVVFWM